MVSKEFQIFINMLYMDIPCFDVNNDVIEKTYHKIMKIWTQTFIHEALKGRGRITIFKGNYKKLTMTFMWVKSCLHNINFFILILWYTKRRLGLVKILEPWSSSKSHQFLVWKIVSLMVNLLKSQKSGHMCQVPSLFKTMTTGDG